jgi:hypothetical protein
MAVTRGISLSDTADMRLVLEHTKKIRAFLEKETPALFQVIPTLPI